MRLLSKDMRFASVLACHETLTFCGLPVAYLPRHQVADNGNWCLFTACLAACGGSFVRKWA